jgi:hypothetical protein
MQGSQPDAGEGALAQATRLCPGYDNRGGNARCRAGRPGSGLDAVGASLT